MVLSLRATHSHSNTLHSYLKMFGGLYSERGIRTEMSIFKQLVMAVWSSVLKRMSGNVLGQWEGILLDNDVSPTHERKPVPRCYTCWEQMALVAYTEHFKVDFMWGWRCSFLSYTLKSKKEVSL